MDERQRNVMAHQPPVLLALARRYAKSKAGREGASGDFLADFRELLKASNSHDGEARVRAEEDLRRARHASGGLLELDLHPRDATIIHRVRLHPDAENWLFRQLGQEPPSARRYELHAFFRQHAAAPEPRSGWRDWLLDLSANALSGSTVQPFEREDMPFNAELLRVTEGVLRWNGESLIRYASAVICGDSKRLESLLAPLLQALRAITGDASVTLETFRILQTPRAVLIHGPLVLELPGGTLDLGLLAGPVAVAATDLELAGDIRCPAPACLTVENEGVFRELAKRNPGILLVHTSFPGAATRHLLRRLPESLPCYHFGDSDPAGFDILRDLREKTARFFHPVLMDFRPTHQAQPLTQAERKTVARLLESPSLADIRPALHAMLDHGTKGDFEQESLGPCALNHCLDLVLGNPITHAPG